MKKKVLADLVLLGLEKAIESEVQLLDFLYHSGEYLYSGYPRKLNYGALYEAIKSLREKGFIETRKDEGKIYLKLTDQGRERAILERIIQDERWDGKWRVVIFDIPEQHRNLRNVLRWKLREWEFQPLQKSVWVTKKDVTKPLKSFINEVGLAQWVKILVAEDIE